MTSPRRLSSCLLALMIFFFAASTLTANPKPTRSRKRSPKLQPVMNHTQEPTAAQILFPGGKRVELPINGRETIRAYVHDKEGNRLRTAEIKWAPADPDHNAFVFVAPNVNKDGLNSVDVSWLPGKPEIKTPSEIKLVARSGEAAEIVIINYKPAKLEKVVVSLEPKQIFIGPGQSATVEVTARGEDQRVIKIEESEASIGDELARKYITAFADKKTITIVGMYGDPKSPPDTLVRSVLVVKVAGGLATIPVIYQRDPAVVDWDIIPPNIVGDNYGRTIKNDFYCIEVTIQNNSGSDLALAGLRFYNGEFYRPTAGFGIVRGSLAKRKLTHPRSMTLAIVDSVGSLMTGFNPFFHNANHGKNFSNIIDIVSNPLAKGLEKTWKDPYPDEVARFEQDVLRDDKIIPNGGVFKTRIFVPKRSVFPSTEQAQFKNDLAKVRKELGSLWVLGYKFEKGAIHNIGSSR